MRTREDDGDDPCSFDEGLCLRLKSPLMPLLLGLVKRGRGEGLFPRGSGVGNSPLRISIVEYNQWRTMWAYREA